MKMMMMATLNVDGTSYALVAADDETPYLSIALLNSMETTPSMDDAL
jgi:hypothetical protein